MTRQDPAGAPDLASAGENVPARETVAHPPVPGPDIAEASAAGESVRARTQAQLEAEIAGWGDVPMYQPPADRPEPSGGAAALPTSPQSSDPGFSWLYRPATTPSTPAPAAPAAGGPDTTTAERTAVSSRGMTAARAAGDDGGPPTEPLTLSEIFGRGAGFDVEPRRAARSSPSSQSSPSSPAAGPPRRAAPQSSPLRATGFPPRATVTASGRPGRNRRRRRRVLTSFVVGGVASATMVAAFAAVGGFGLLPGQQVPGAVAGSTAHPPSTDPDPSTPAPPPSSAAPVGQVWAGETQAIQRVQVSASCLARPARGSDGKPVRYDAANLLDGDTDTAWRCDDQQRPSLVFSVPRGQQLAEVGLINGYTKVDPSDETSRYTEYRRVRLVRWHLPDGTTVDQRLDDQDTSLQTVKVPVTGSGTLRLEIMQVSDPGLSSVTRDAVVIPEVYLGAPAR